MSQRNLIAIASLILLMSACRLGQGPAEPTTTSPVPTGQPVTATIAASSPVPVEASPTPTAAPNGEPQADLQFIAYMSSGQLVVTDVTNGVQGGTTQYTAPGQADQVMDLVWSPSGEFVAFVAPMQENPHIFYIYALGQSSPTDLGPGTTPAWSPDSKSLAYIGGDYPNENLWITSIENAAPRQLTFETDHAWGGPAFTPDGQALIVSTADRFNMGAQGNTSFTLERLELDGSGTRTPLPGMAPIDGARLPYDLHFSPDGTRLGFSTSFHLSACASPGAYYVLSANGGTYQTLISPSLATVVDPARERDHVGLSYSWSRSSDGLFATGTVVDCDFNSPTMGQVVAEPQLSLLRFDGSEGVIIPGVFYSPSVDRSGTMVAAAHYKDIQDQNPAVELYSVESGQLVLSLGPGSMPHFQP